MTTTSEHFKELAALVPDLRGRRILVYGDLVADEFVFTQEPRVSREAPVLILEYQDSSIVPGGAANAALNIAALGGVPVILGELGDDQVGEEVLRQLREAGADTQGIASRGDMATPRKSRILAGDRNVAVQQVVRIDRLPRPPRGEAYWREVKARTVSLLSTVDGVLVSDYGLGFVDPESVSTLLLNAPERGRLKVALDSRHRLFEYRGVDICTPSESELEEAVGRSLRDPTARERGGRDSLARLEAAALLLTRGSQGMELLERDEPTLAIPAFGTETVTDVTGAGDTVIATISLALAAGASPSMAAELANAAAGIVVTKLGTATVGGDELSAALNDAG